MVNDVELMDEEKTRFHDDGFVVLREFIPADVLAELRAGYDAATRGDYDVDGWNQKIARGDILQLGMPNAHIPGWWASLFGPHRRRRQAASGRRYRIQVRPVDLQAAGQ